jgi:hypothetical protein
MFSRCGVLTLVFALACGSSNSVKTDAPGSNGSDGSNSMNDGKMPDTPNGGSPRTIFVIPMENEPSSAIYGNTTYAPYINGLLAQAARATNFGDELPSDPSEPHYVFMEAGTAAFSDNTFTNDDDPSSSNSTASTAHLVNTLEAAHVTWMSYQQGISAGECPVNSSNEYAAKHDPFVFFQDVVGNPPSTSTARCVAHHKPYTSFVGDLGGGSIAQYVFITPDLCHDMHGDGGCPQGTDVNQNILAGDTWLSNELPRILTYANAHDGVVFITWDEGDSSNLIPFLALGPRIHAGHTSTVRYTHGSMVKSIQEILGATVLSKVAATNDFADLFQAGMFP